MLWTASFIICEIGFLDFFNRLCVNEITTFQKLVRVWDWLNQEAQCIRFLSFSFLPEDRRFGLRNVVIVLKYRWWIEFRNPVSQIIKHRRQKLPIFDLDCLRSFYDTIFKVTIYFTSIILRMYTTIIKSIMSIHWDLIFYEFVLEKCSWSLSFKYESDVKRYMW
jgi:hypothetical protein